MSRITINDLKEVINTRNSFLVHSGSNFLFKENSRNGYTCVDLHFIDENGRDVCQCDISGSTPRECIDSVYSEASCHMGKIKHGCNLSRKMAKSILLGHINFNKDPAQLVQSELELLHTWAKLTKYKKPVNFSHGYGFFIHLKNKVKL